MGCVKEILQVMSILNGWCEMFIYNVLLWRVVWKKYSYIMCCNLEVVKFLPCNYIVLHWVWRMVCSLEILLLIFVILFFIVWFLKTQHFKDYCVYLLCIYECCTHMHACVCRFVQISAYGCFTCLNKWTLFCQNGQWNLSENFR